MKEKYGRLAFATDATDDPTDWAMAFAVALGESIRKFENLTEIYEVTVAIVQKYGGLATT